MSAIARDGGIRVLGPNCQGLANFAEGIPLTFSGALYEVPRPLPGHVALVSQSGAFGFSSFGVGLEHGVRFRYVATTGNQSDLDAVECADYVLDDPEVRLLMLYLEGLEDGAGFLRLVRKARERDIAIVVLKGGDWYKVKGNDKYKTNVTIDKWGFPTPSGDFGGLGGTNFPDLRPSTDPLSGRKKSGFDPICKSL